MGNLRESEKNKKAVLVFFVEGGKRDYVIKCPYLNCPGILQGLLLFFIDSVICPECRGEIKITDPNNIRNRGQVVTSGNEIGAPPIRIQKKAIRLKLIGNLY